MMSEQTQRSALIIGASRGLGYALAAEFLRRGWDVTATERTPSDLRDLVGASEGRLVVGNVDITDPERVSALRERVTGRTFDLLFVNAGVNYTSDPAAAFTDVSTEDFVEVMVTTR